MVEPGQREAYQEAQAVRPRSSRPKRAKAELGQGHARRAAGLSARSAISISPTSRATRLSNGVEVVYAHRTAVPVTQRA